MASNNYVPVKVLQAEIAALCSESVLLDRERRLERVLLLFHLGLIDDMQCKELNKLIIKKFPEESPDSAAYIPPVSFDETLSKDDLIKIQDALLSRIYSLNFEIKMASQASGPGQEQALLKYRSGRNELNLVYNKVCKMLHHVPDEPLLEGGY